MRASANIVSILLLIIIAIAAAVAIHLYLQGVEKPAPPGLCHAAIEAVNVTRYKGIYVWFRAIDCDLTVDTAYLRYPDWTLAVQLQPLTPVKVRRGSVSILRLIPTEQVKSGEYILTIPIRKDDVWKSIRIPFTMPGGQILRNKSLQELNGTILEKTAYRVIVNVSIYEQQFDTYKVTVRVCAKRGYWINYVRIEVYNASLEPPVWVGQYHVFVESEKYLPFTYPDCSIADFYPIRGNEQPLTIMVLVEWRRG
ncbi:hypothetical protein Pyrfu_1757 [Pyrolobus fumarii 1A]|uniref:Uncharacterized protein n=1 Tax=Pyrolobus fumarii (strain DSM 11204 / 1A) TaxID=694429 RepID=G0ECP1_PYRF1|nr:hypothetical protein [Pyrolobus fumarii]AEM39611.1 hypothetical protein Pyrfu_1757 [Pyrolobus fumarii 1A]